MKNQAVHTQVYSILFFLFRHNETLETKQSITWFTHQQCHDMHVLSKWNGTKTYRYNLYSLSSKKKVKNDFFLYLYHLQNNNVICFLHSCDFCNRFMYYFVYNFSFDTLCLNSELRFYGCCNSRLFIISGSVQYS